MSSASAPWSADGSVGFPAGTRLLDGTASSCRTHSETADVGWCQVSRTTRVLTSGEAVLERVEFGEECRR